MPKIIELLLKLEGFQYAMSLDLIMGYYYIWLSDNKSKLCTIIIHSLPMGVSYSPDILQKKMNDLFKGFEFIRAYIDEILVLIKGD